MQAKKSALQPIPRPGPGSRLHLYLAWACPFCHRVLASLALAGLDARIGVTWMINIKGADGWRIRAGDDPLFGASTLAAVYQGLAIGADHAAAVPLLVDLTTRRLVSTESARITRFVTRGLNGAYPVRRDLSPAHLEARIDAMNAWLHENVNRAVYGVGFATSQSGYEHRVARLFRSLDRVEARLGAVPYLLGEALTESDLYLLATLVRFDSVYHPLFKCSYRRIAEYPQLSRYLDHLLELDGMAATYRHAETKNHYYLSLMHVGGEVRDLNPSRLVPVDPCPRMSGPESFAAGGSAAPETQLACLP